MSDSLDILIKLVLDEAAQKRVAGGISTVDDELAKVEAHTSKGAKELLSYGYSAEAAAKRMTQEYKQATGSAEKLEKTTEKLGKTTNKATDSAKQMTAALQQQRTTLTQVRDASEKIGQYSQAAFLTGTAIVGGIIAAGQAYIDSAEESTQLTREWMAATKELSQSGSRVGAVMAQEALPLLKQAAELANEAAGFIEEHPDIIKAALNTGVVLAGLGAVGMAVTKGIRLVADVGLIANTAMQLQAAVLQNGAGDKQIVAASIQAGVPKIPPVIPPAVPGLIGAGALAAAGTGVAIAGTVLAGAAIGTGAYQGIATSEAGKKANLATVPEYATVGAKVFGDLLGKISGLDPEEAARKTDVFTALIGKWTGAIDKNSPLWQKGLEAANAGPGASGSASGAALGMLAGSIHEKELVAAYGKMLEEDKKATEKYQKDIGKINDDAHEKELKAAEKNADAIAKINVRYADKIAKIAADEKKAEQREEQKRTAERATILRDAGVEISRIEQDSQERRRNLLLDHEETVSGLLINRDAMGLVREQRSYQRKKDDEERQTNIDIGRRQEDLAIRLGDLQAQAALERTQRLQDYQDKLAEAAQAHLDDLAEQQNSYTEQRTALAQAKADELTDLKTNYQDQQTERTNAFVTLTKELDAALLGEQGLKKKYYGLMLDDAQKFYDDYRARLAGNGGGSVPPVPPKTGTGGGGGGGGTGGRRADGGYADYGSYILGDSASGGPGRREFVLSGRATQAAEAAIGGQLSQARVMASFSGGSSNSKHINYTDNRRFSGGISAQDRRAIRQDTVDVMVEIIDND